MVEETTEYGSRMPERKVIREVLRSPTWYIQLKDFLEKEIFPIVQDKDEELFRIREMFYSLVEEMLNNEEIPLDKGVHGLDGERKPIDSVVIHHTAGNSGMTANRLSAIGFIRQYAQYYLDQDDTYGLHELKGQPIGSGHFSSKGKMVFHAYHWIVRPDGKTERLLEDSAYGMHAGKSINPRSIGIVIDGDYRDIPPPPAQIEAVAKIIKEHYPQIKSENILGHNEVMENRVCPGETFLPREGFKGWRNIVRDLV